MTSRTRAALGALASLPLLLCAGPARAAGGSAFAVALDGQGRSHTYALALAPNGSITSVTELGSPTAPGRYLDVTDAMGAVAVGTVGAGDLTDVVTVDLSTGARHVVAHRAASPVLSPDGQRVYFVTQTLSVRPGKQLLAWVGVTGGTKHVLLRPPKGRNFDALTAVPGRSAILASTYTPLQGGSQADFARLRPPVVYRVPLGHPHLVRIHTRKPLYGVSAGSLTVSPNGKLLAAGCNITQGDDPVVDIVNLTTGALQAVPRSVGLRSPTSWSPDGHWIEATRAYGGKAPAFDRARVGTTTHHAVTGLPSGQRIQSLAVVR